MGLFTYLFSKYANFADKKQLYLYDSIFDEKSTKLFYKICAIETVVNIISSSLALSEFKTFENGKEKRAESYYLFNQSPNPNQNATQFFNDVIRSLVYKNNALIVMIDDSLYLADDYEKTDYAIKENIYKYVTIRGFPLEKTFSSSDTIHLTLHSSDTKTLIDGLYKDYGELIEYSKGAYKKNNAMRGIFNIPTSYPATQEARAELNALLQKQAKDFFKSENGAILPLTNGITYNDLTNHTYKNSSDSRDIRALIDDVYDFVGQAFLIPSSLLKGTSREDNNDFDTFMMFCFKPLLKMIENEINRKYYGKNSFLNKTYLYIDASKIQQHSIKDIATTIDILTRNGVNTLNDNLSLLGRAEDASEYGSKRYITLNLREIDKDGE